MPTFALAENVLSAAVAFHKVNKQKVDLKFAALPAETDEHSSEIFSISFGRKKKKTHKHLKALNAFKWMRNAAEDTNVIRVCLSGRGAN